MSAEIPIGRDVELEENIIQYLDDKPPFKTTITSRELYKNLEVKNHRRAAETLKVMSEKGVGPIGERLEENYTARWRLK